MNESPDAELQLNPLTSLEQLEAVRSGRLDAGFIYNMPKADRELDQFPVGLHKIALAAPKGHPLSKLKNLRLRDMADSRFIWFPRRESPAFYDRLMNECFRSGLKTPRIVQEAVERSNHIPEPGFAGHGRGVRQRHRALEMSRIGRLYLIRDGPDPATSIGSGLEEG